MRCPWCGDDPLYVGYHDAEWGRPVADDQRLFEKICLEGFQAGLSWITILRKREQFRAAFAGFDIERLASFGLDDVERLASDPGIVRHRGKIRSAIHNARCALALRAEAGSLAAFLWRFAPAPTPAPRAVSDIPAHTAQSTALSKALRARGWSFVGPTTMYAMMQAVGLVNDHLADCPTREPCDAARRAFTVPGSTPSPSRL